MAWPSAWFFPSSRDGFFSGSHVLGSNQLSLKKEPERGSTRIPEINSGVYRCGVGDWKVTLWEDAPDSSQNAEHLVKNEKTVRPCDTLQLKLAPSGGTVAIFSPAK
jgi:hypothetical protein